jgi:hypothetical protein
MSAASVVDRYAMLVEKALGTDPTRLGLPVEQSSSLEGVLTELSNLLASARGPSGDAVERIEFPDTPAGSSSSVTLWLHNPLPEPIAGVSVRCAGLVRADGAPGDTPAVDVSPSGVTVPGGGSACFVLEARVPEGLQPGVHLGLAVPGPVPGDPVVVALRVTGARDG